MNGIQLGVRIFNGSSNIANIQNNSDLFTWELPSIDIPKSTDSNIKTLVNIITMVVS